MDSISNLADAMLVFMAVGIMLALIINWNGHFLGRTDGRHAPDPAISL